MIFIVLISPHSFTQVQEIPLAEYLTLLPDSEPDNLDPSMIQKHDSGIRIPLNGGEMVFTDHSEKDCQACIKQYHVVGEIKSLDKIIIEEGHFRHSDYLIIDRISGKIDTLDGYPWFSPQQDLLVVAGPASAEGSSPGIQSFQIRNGHLILEAFIPISGRIKSLTWLSSREILVMTVGGVGSPNDHPERYFRIRV